MKKKVEEKKLKVIEVEAKAIVEAEAKEKV